MPMRLLIFLAGCWFLGLEPLPSPAQCRNPVSQWAYTFLSPSGGGKIYDVAVAPDGNVFFTGAFGGTFDFDPGEGSDIRDSANGAIFVTMLRADRSYGWTRAFAVSARVYLGGIAVAPNGDVLIAGQFSGTVDFDPGEEVDQRTSTGDSRGSNAFLLRFSRDGDYLGTIVFGTGTVYGVGASGVTADSPGNVYVAGISSGTADFDPTDEVDEHTATGFLTKFNADGTYAWTWTFWNGQYGFAQGVAVDAADNVFVRGEFRGTVDFDPGDGVDLHTARAPGAVYVTRLNGDGSYGWTRTWDIYSSETYDGLTVDRDGNVLITGGFGGTRDFDPTPDVEDWHVSEGPGSVYITKLTGEGAYLWTRQIGGLNGHARGNGIAANPNGGIALTGHFVGTVDFDPGGGVYERTSLSHDAFFDLDVFVTMLDADGSHVWTRTFGGVQDDDGWVLGVDGDGSVVVVGYFNTSADLDPGCAEDIYRSDLIGATFGYLVKLSCVPPTADGNGDGVVNLLDLAALQNCFSGPAPTTCNPGCYQFDLDGDDDIDLLDFAELQRVFTAP
jgi:hypothetical protein